MYFDELVICTFASDLHICPLWTTYLQDIIILLSVTRIQMVTVLLLKMSAPCSNALPCPFLHVQHCPPHQGRVDLRNLPDNVGLQLLEGGRTTAVNLGFDVAP